MHSSHYVVTCVTQRPQCARDDSLQGQLTVESKAPVCMVDLGPADVPILHIDVGEGPTAWCSTVHVTVLYIDCPGVVDLYIAMHAKT